MEGTVVFSSGLFFFGDRNRPARRQSLTARLYLSADTHIHEGSNGSRREEGGEGESDKTETAFTMSSSFFLNLK